jgi:ABC-type transporter Mla subunit MlaD
MPSPSERGRNNIRAGAFVSIALLLGLVVVIILTDAIESLRRSTATYTVTFDVASGVANLKPGSEVRVGGVRMGEVLDIVPRLAQGEAFRQIAVEFTVDRRIDVFADARVLVSAPLIGSEAWLDIPSVGNPAAGPPVAGQLQGITSVGFLTSLLGSENAGKANEMVENARQFTDFLAGVPDEYQTRIVPTLHDLQVTASSAREVVDDFQTSHWPTWSESVDKVLTWAAGASDNLDRAIAEGHGLLAESRSVVAENREPIKSIVTNVESATAAINTQTIDKFHALLDRGQQGLDEAVGVMEELRIDYGGWATNIGEALANANLAAQQLKLTTIETRRSPWKLLYRPSSDELEHELLYEAARSFAVAAADLKAASESVQRVLTNHADKIAGSEEAYRRLEHSLLESLANYEKAQQQLLDVIVMDGKKE